MSAIKKNRTKTRVSPMTKPKTREPTRVPPLSKDGLTKRSTLQLGSKDGAKCTIRFGLHSIDENKKSRTISIFPPSDVLVQLKEFDAANDELNNIVKIDDDDREYVTLKVHVKKTKCVDHEGNRIELDMISRDDECLIIAKPVAWKMKEHGEGVCLRVKMIQIVEQEEEEEEEFEFV